VATATTVTANLAAGDFTAAGGAIASNYTLADNREAARGRSLQ